MKDERYTIMSSTLGKYMYSYKKKVEETLQEAYNQNARHHTPIATGVCVMLINIAKELGVEIN